MNLKISGYVLVLMFLLCSCNQEQKDLLFFEHIPIPLPN